MWWVSMKQWSSGDHQLSFVVYPIISRVLYIPPGGDRRISEPSTVVELGNMQT